MSKRSKKTKRKMKLKRREKMKAQTPTEQWNQKQSDRFDEAIQRGDFDL